MQRERIQKVIAASGQYSRRAVERLIAAHKVKVNGIVVTQQGVKIDPLSDRLHIDGKSFVYQQKRPFIALALHKPRHVLVSRSDPQARKTVYDLLPKELKNLRPVGRLDYNTQGLLLLTNDGDFLHRLSHPSYEIEKEYIVKLSSRPDERQLRRLRQGIILEGERTHPVEFTVLQHLKAGTLCRVTLHEGRYREIRHMCTAVGLMVKELKRVRVGPVCLKNLRSGSFRWLTRKELKVLKC